MCTSIAAAGGGLGVASASMVVFHKVDPEQICNGVRCRSRIERPGSVSRSSPGGSITSKDAICLCCPTCSRDNTAHRFYSHAIFFRPSECSRARERERGGRGGTRVAESRRENEENYMLLLASLRTHSFRPYYRKTFLSCLPSRKLSNIYIYLYIDTRALMLSPSARNVS